MIFSSHNPISIIYVFSAAIIMIVAFMAMYFQFAYIKSVENIKIQHQNWNSTVPKNMSYKVTHGCMFSMSYKVYRINGTTHFEDVENFEKRYQKNISDLFSTIEKATVDAYSLNVIYNSDNGYPEEIKIDWNKDVYDDECFYVVEDFEING